MMGKIKSIPKEKYIYILLIAPFLQPPILGYVPQVNKIFFIAKLLSALVVLFFYIKELKYSKFIIAIGLYEFAIVLSTFINKGDLTGALGDAAAVVVLCMLVERQLKKDVAFALRVFIYTFLAYALINIATLILTYPEGLFYVNGNMYFIGTDNRFVFILLPLVTFSLIYSELTEGKLNWKSIGILVMSFLMLVSVWSVAAMLGIGMFAIYCLFIYKKNRFRVFNYLSYGAFFIVSNILILVFKIQDKFSFILEALFKKDVTFSGRVYLWQWGLAYIKKSPLIGYGIEFTDVIAKKFSGYTHLHNYIINILYVGGIIALIIFFLIHVVVGRKLMKYKSNAMAGVTSFSLFIALILSIFDTLEFPLFFVMLLFGYHIDELMKQQDNLVAEKATIISNKKE